MATKASGFYRFFLGPLLALPLVVMLAINPWQFFRKSITGKTGFLVAVCGATFIGLGAAHLLYPPLRGADNRGDLCAGIAGHAVPAAVALARKARRAGHGARAIPAICVLLFLLRAVAPQLHIPTPVEWKHTWDSEHYQNLDRAKALAQLEALPGKQLVIVRYNQYHDLNNEWVYNRADIDAAKIVWARDMGDSENAELIRYFPKRRVWLAEPDLAPPRLSPYPVSADQGTASPAPANP